MNNRFIYRNAETILITLMWLVVIIAPFLFQNNADDLSLRQTLRPYIIVIPLFLLFLINRLFLVPYLLFKKKTAKYFVFTTTIIIVFVIGLFLLNPLPRPGTPDIPRGPMPHQQPPHMRGPQMQDPMQREPHQPLPLYANFLIYAILIIGFDTGLRASFQWAKSEKEMEELEKENVSNQLDMLRHQVSPHFFMNTLNNIHTLIDMDTENAKDSVMKLSKMMRYLLYETAHDKTTLQKEIEFMESYVELMKLRVSEKVDIQVHLPENPPQRSLPPLLFTSFIENAFKHGVSYQKDSFIHIDLQADEDRLALQIKNSKGLKKEEDEASGIGLANVKKRLDLIYGEAYHLDIFETTDQFSINLSIPLSDD